MSAIISDGTGFALATTMDTIKLLITTVKWNMRTVIVGDVSQVYNIYLVFF